MIIFRYLSREVLINMMAVTFVLLIIIMSGRFIKYLAEAAAGELSANVLYGLILLRIPGFLELLLPLGLFIGILLAYGRLYLENEITVLRACGMSHHRLLLITLGPTVAVALVVAFMSLWATPWGSQRVEAILLEQEQVTEFEALVPGRFHETEDGRRVTYAEGLEEERTRLAQVFLAGRSGKPDDPRLGVVMAESGRQSVDPETGVRYLVLENGHRYEGVPGQADYRRVDFGEYGVKIERTPVLERVSKVETLPTGRLLGSEEIDHQAQLHWRLSLPVLCLVVSVLAVPLSRVNPRQGRFARLLPSILIYLLYISILTSVRSALEKGDLEQVAALWWVHIGFGLLAINLHFFALRWAQLWWWCWGLLPRWTREE
ncbi:LPS export ABC transporter permease LptF [Motiliproteus sp. SC1-56]|uniref:LPS export ABC transporter permease LptF n=1 Tax=Motiliproteus sp. SC1-56 TaxID=2799565 RepID=UPI001A8DF4E9